jgi:hypothetical protein
MQKLGPRLVHSSETSRNPEIARHLTHRSCLLLGEPHECEWLDLGDKRLVSAIR